MLAVTPQLNLVLQTLSIIILNGFIPKRKFLRTPLLQIQKSINLTCSIPSKAPVTIVVLKIQV